LKKLVYIGYFCLVCSATSSHANTINIIGTPKNMGWGDVLSNIWMAQQIHASKPNTEVHFIVDETYLKAEGFETIFPGLNPNQPIQKIGGIIFHIPVGEAANRHYLGVEKTSCNLTFSSREISKIAKKIQFSPLLSFNEYSGIDPHAHKVSLEETKEGGKIIRLDTDADSLGMYVTAKSPEPQASLSVESEELGSTPDDQIEVGFAYVNFEASTLAYVENMISYAKNHPRKTIQLHVKESKALENRSKQVDFPKNLDLKTYSFMPFSQTIEIIKAATLPIMVTGDMSATLAIQFEKRFIYEQLNHKESFARALNHIAGGDFTGGNIAIPVGQSTIPEKITKLVGENMEFWKKSKNKESYLKSVRSKRKVLSLPEKVFQMCQVLKKTGSASNLEKFYLDASDFDDPDTIIKDLNDELARLHFVHDDTAKKVSDQHEKEIHPAANGLTNSGAGSSSHAAGAK
jgi:hypothetical protein